ncbi:MAG: aldo/keto reductase [Longimicrobiales bacterium]|nr:aldo/keto reductase [Longimicrobiales bacterium]
MITRRDWLKATAAAGAALSLDPRDLWALSRQEILTRTIPGTSERVPAVGLGSSATFSTVARSEDYSALREVLASLVGNGGTVFDTAPGYGASEEVAGTIAKELGLTDKIFWATKVNVAGRGDTPADPAAARAQIERSFERIGKRAIDLIQVHNMGDPPTQLAILQEYKAAGRVRYIGITTTDEDRYGDLMDVMRSYPVDFIGIDYAVDNRAAADRVFPLAQERGIGVLAYAPFGRTRLWSRVAGREVPEWAAEFDARTWAQFFLKFVLAHPAVTAVTPATSRATNMVDNLGAAVGRLPSPDQVRRRVEHVEALPPA